MWRVIIEFTNPNERINDTCPEKWQAMLRVYDAMFSTADDPTGEDNITYISLYKESA